LPPPPNIDGQSLASLLDGGGTGSDPTYQERPAFVFHKHGSVVRTTDWAYIRYVDGSEELYDMQNDPGQLTNLASDELSLPTLQGLRIQLDERLANRKFIVDSTLDTPDAIPGDGKAEDADGNVTLRAAIEEANAMPGKPTIHFDIPGSGPHTIVLDSALPTITHPVTIDGTTESHYAGTPIIELDGSKAGPHTHGLVITSGGSTVRGLSIVNFSSSGIVLMHGGGNTIERNFIGTDLDGTKEQGNGHNGIVILDSPNNVVGGPLPQNGNIISGNDVYGVYMLRSGATGNIVQHNLVGLAADGASSVGNGKAGVRIGGGASDNRIVGNAISGNGAEGVRIDGQQSSGNWIVDNAIGLDATATSLTGNQGWGVVIYQAGANLVGGAEGDSGNVIAGNALGGVGVSGAASRGNAIRRNSIYSNGNLAQPGIDLNHDGRTLNDAASGDEDSDTGPHNLQNFPLLETAGLLDTQLVIEYSVPSATTNSNYGSAGLVIEFFLADAADGEGRIFLGSDMYTEANALSLRTVMIDVSSVLVSPDDWIVGTATDADGNTSEFSFSVLVTTSSPLFATEAATEGIEADALTEEELAPLVAEGLDRWSQAALSAEQILVLNNVRIRAADLPGSLLALATGNTLLVDDNAAGRGWFVDSTPWDDEEFRTRGDSKATVSYDLLTVVMHELGHHLGLPDLHESLGDQLMSPLLSPGERRASLEAATDLLFADLSRS
jgi:hypothetical protein